MSAGAPLVAALAARARALPRRSTRVILGIAGAPGAGKSTLASAVAALAGGVVVAMDGFHLADDELRALGRYERKGAPDTFDAAGYVALLHRLRSDRGPVPAPRFDRTAEAVVPDALTVAAGGLVITEGNYLLLDSGPWAEVAGLLDETWFVEVEEVVRVERLVARFVSYGWAAEVARERVTRGSDARNAALVATTRAHADLVVSLPGPLPGLPPEPSPG